MSQTIQLIQIDPQEFSAMLAEQLKAVIPTVSQRPELLTLTDAAEFFKVSKNTVMRWVEKGIVKGFTIHNEPRFYLSDLKDALVAIESKNKKA